MENKLSLDARIIQELGLLNNQQIQAIAKEYEQTNLVNLFQLLDKVDLQTLKVVQAYCMSRQADKKLGKELADIEL